MIISPFQPAQILVGIVAGVLISLSGVFVWNVVRSRLYDLDRTENSFSERNTIFLIGLLIVAAFAMGVFFTYVVLSLRL